MHPELDELLMYADHELSARAAARLEKHLSACEDCSVQFRRLQAASAEVAAAQDRSLPELPDIAGPRAMLRARLSETARLDHAGGSNALRLARGLAYACALAVLVVGGIRAVSWENGRATPDARLRPDPAFTPGLTRAVSLTELCSLDHDEVVRSVPAALEQRVLHEYGIAAASPADYEVDYLITPGLGGADDLRNLWPQPHAHTVWNSYAKDQLEDRLHGMVCSGTLSLPAAQQEIAGDWISAYRKYFHAEQPVTNQHTGEFADPSALQTAHL